jgi:hypothetical protein
MAGNPVVPFENLVQGKRYLITLYEDNEHTKVRTQLGHSLKDLAGTLLEKSRFYTKVKMDVTGQEHTVTTSLLEFKLLGDGIKPGTILDPGADALPGSLPGETPIQVAEIDADADCAICMEPKKDKSRYVGKCGHSIHDECYKRLANKAPPGQVEQKECPLCRKLPFGGRRKSRKSKKRTRKTRRR